MKTTEIDRRALQGRHRIPALGNWLYRMEMCRHTRLKPLSEIATLQGLDTPVAEGGGIFWLYRGVVYVACAWLPPPWAPEEICLETWGEKHMQCNTIFQALEQGAERCNKFNLYINSAEWFGAWCTLCGDVPWDKISDLPLDNVRLGRYLAGEWRARIGGRPVNPELLRMVL